MTVTKTTLMQGQYHQLIGQVPTQSGVTNGEIIDVLGSLGQRPASSLTVESYPGETTIRLNVCKKLHKNQYEGGNAFLPFAAFYTQPYVVDEVEQVKDDIIIPSGAIWSISREEMEVCDFKVVNAPSGVVFTFM